jgi:Cu-Zn family superoxide dismutase
MLSRTAVILAWSVALVACEPGRRDAGREGDRPARAQDSPSPAAAISLTVAMRDATGKDLGTLTLTEEGQGITLAGRLTGLPPGEHAIHLHAVGRCDAPSFESAGDHWNPTNRQHGTKSPQGPHLGDLPNFTVAQNRSATIQATTQGGTLRRGNLLLDRDGAAVVVHARRDDYKTQPSGDSGDRIACGVAL